VSACVIKVIQTTLLRRGDGKKTPVRIIEQFWSLDGALLAENDPLAKIVYPENEEEL